MKFIFFIIGPTFGIIFLIGIFQMKSLMNSLGDLISTLLLIIISVIFLDQTAIILLLMMKTMYIIFMIIITIIR